MFTVYAKKKKKKKEKKEESEKSPVMVRNLNITMQGVYRNKEDKN